MNLDFRVRRLPSRQDGKLPIRLRRWLSARSASLRLSASSARFLSSISVCERTSEGFAHFHLGRAAPHLKPAIHAIEASDGGLEVVWITDAIDP